MLRNLKVKREHQRLNLHRNNTLSLRLIGLLIGNFASDTPVLPNSTRNISGDVVERSLGGGWC